MKIDVGAVRKCLKSFDFKTLFREHLGWDNHRAKLDIPVDDDTVHLTAVAQKRGFVAFTCPAIPDRPTRLKIDHKVTKSAREHFIIYTDESAGKQVWQWVRREPGKPLASRDHRFDIAQSGDPLIQRLEQIAISLDEEERITVVDVAGRTRAAFDVVKVTKKFYDRFKAEHATFLKFINGIKTKTDLQWYTSLMLNRLMFVYFIQKKGFLDGDVDYLRNRLAMVRKVKGKDKFHSFYRYFLLRLFHEGLGKSPDERKLDAAMKKLLGKVPFLDGGFFEVHELEERNTFIDIPDKAFENLFNFFDKYSWHLDERPLRADNEINPDIVGYIFEKYINQKQMGAYYTKEDITEYISKSTIIPFLFDAAQKKCAIAFKEGSFLWRLLRDDPDRYIYPAVRQGVIDDKGNVIALPKDIKAGIKDVSKRDGWNKPAVDPYALPTETWREHVARRTRCMEIRRKLSKGKVHAINDLITMNLDIWQFARDAIVSSEGPELLRAFWYAIEKVTVLDPTCGSGAFLFAALRILETLFSDCLERMERFVEELTGKRHRPEKYSDFKKVLAQISKHHNERYFVLKSIIINNLFGVDIMDEAVEICKLRLFLKLVAQVDKVDQIEPLPDIDFNIRAGNTLVGYASLDQVRESIQNLPGQDLGLVFEEEEARIHRIEEGAELVERAFTQFRAQQTTHGGRVTHKDKQELRRRLDKLDSELDRYLAGEYAINVERQKHFEKWRNSHQPFHWFVEFYGIMQTGGFDVIIGNPPFIEYAKVRSKYATLGYRTEKCGNLYAQIFERSTTIVKNAGRSGLIIPMAGVTSRRMQAFRDMLAQATSVLYVSSFAGDAHPAILFEGVRLRISIVLCGHTTTPEPHSLYTTIFQRWYAIERILLFHRITLWSVSPGPLWGVFPRLGGEHSQSVWKSIFKAKHRETLSAILGTGATVFYQEAAQYFVKASKNVPYFSKNGVVGAPPHGRFVNCTKAQAPAVMALLSSSLFYLWYHAVSDCYHVSDAVLKSFPCPASALSDPHLANLGRRLETELHEQAKTVEISTRTGDTIAYAAFNYQECKQMLDDIDRTLAQHYGFTEEELDFIINYDIKYRIGVV